VFSDMTSSSASSRGWGRRCVGGGGDISSSISEVGEPGCWIGGELGMAVWSRAEVWGVEVFGVGEGVEGVDVISVECSPSSTRTLGGKN
jgi:hypothetical protein